VLFAGIGAAVGDVVVDRVVEQHSVLRHDTDRAAQTGLRDIAYVLTVDENSALADIVKAKQ
jgi:hypothetical protein